MKEYEISTGDIDLQAIEQDNNAMIAAQEEMSKEKLEYLAFVLPTSILFMNT